MSARRRSSILVLTPATRFGSWAWIEKVLTAAREIPTTVVSYGRSNAAPPEIQFVGLPALIDYGKWGPRLAERKYLALNLLYYAPLAPLAWIFGLRSRVLVANGVNSAAILAPLTYLDKRLILAFHGSIEHAGPTWHRVLRRMLARVDTAFVNSEGSALDLGHVIGQERIVVVEHWADAVFFETPLERPGSNRLRVVFVGRLDEEKFEQCLRVCSALAAEGVVELTAYGTGPLAGRLGAAGLVHGGYVSDKTELARAYANADVVWAAADLTYISIPGVEGLAAGCPLVVSDVPAVSSHAMSGQRIPRDLIPSSIGNVVSGDIDEEAEALLRRWSKVGIEIGQRAACRRYAEQHHSARNLEPVLAALR